MYSNNSGKIVAFLGPDGAGKSTVLGLVQAQLANQQQEFCYRYFAPGFLKRYRPTKDDSITTDPHEGKQYGSLLIAAKISLMLFEFRLGITQLRGTTKLALFDRYIHDILIDPRRYRMGELRWWMRIMLKLAPKPDLLIIINAPAETIQRRKQEVPLNETIRQLNAYKDFAATQPKAVVIDNCNHPAEAAQLILTELEALL